MKSLLAVRFSHVRVARPGTAPYDHARSLIEMDCKARTYREIEAWAHRADGTVVETWSADRAKPIAPTAVMNGAADAACSDRWRRQTPMDSFAAFRRAPLSILIKAAPGRRSRSGFGREGWFNRVVSRDGKAAQDALNGLPSDGGGLCVLRPSM